MLFAYRYFPSSLEFPSRDTFSRTLELVDLLMDALKSNQCIPRTTYKLVVWHSVAKEIQNIRLIHSSTIRLTRFESKLPSNRLLRTKHMPS